MPPLDGLRVLDLTRVLAGPYCAMMLGDMGAEVLKIEEPTHGDDTRAWAPHRNGWSTFFLGLNRSKKSVALDLKSAAGADALRRLIATADVLIENFRPGSLAKLGFSYETVSETNPRLVLLLRHRLRASRPQEGPARLRRGNPGRERADGRDRPARRSADQSRGGDHRLPGRALYAMNGILLALRDRDRTGRGQHVDIALMDAMTSALALPAGIYFNTGEAPGREGNQHHTLTPYETIEVADGLVVVAAGNERLWKQFCDAIGAADLERHPDYATNTDRMAHRPQLIAELTPRLARYTRDALIEAAPCAQRTMRPGANHRGGARGPPPAGAGNGPRHPARRPRRDAQPRQPRSDCRERRP